MKKVAIACQGGGSHTAFTAGVLTTLLNHFEHLKNDREYQIVSLSGTSGGAICAFFAWHAILKYMDDPNIPPDTKWLQSFWKTNSTNGNSLSRVMNSCFINIAEMQERGLFPHWDVNPNSDFTKLCQQAYKLTMASWHCSFPFLSPWLPPADYFDFRAILEKSKPNDLESLYSKFALTGPTLLIGAVNVGSGSFKVFSSRKVQVTIDHLLASAAIPTLFPAVEINRQYYWDGLYSENPPADELLSKNVVGDKNLPDELWIIQINPIPYKSDAGEKPQFPKSSSEIADRKNELAGNLSLFHELDRIEKINELLREHFHNKHNKDKVQCQYFNDFGKKYREIAIKIIQMPSELQKELNHTSKVDRDEVILAKLTKAGENSGRIFLQDPSNPKYSWQTIKEQWKAKDS